MSTVGESFLVGLIGEGAIPSLTPALHEREADNHGLRYLYRPIDLTVRNRPATDVGVLLHQACDLGYNACNVTHPCKQEVLAHLDDISAGAAAIGAVNTVLMTDGQLIGANTDVTGFATGLRIGLSEPDLSFVVLMGAGGAGAAVSHALLAAGVQRMAIVDLDSSRAEDRAASLLADIVYRPLVTELVAAATALGAPVLDGGHMATGQAVDTFRLITGLEPDAAQLLGSTDAGLTSLVPLDEPAGFDFVEVKAENTDPVEIVLSQLGFTFGGHHRTKPVRLWQAGDARIVLNEQQARDWEPTIAAVGFEVSDPAQSARRAAQLAAPSVFRRTSAREHELRAVAAPDGTEIFWAEAGLDTPIWAAEFDEGGEPSEDGLISHIDHTNLMHPWHRFDEAVLFYGSVLALQSQSTVEVAGPVGLVRSQVMRTRGAEVRLVLNVAPLLEADDRGRRQAQHVAFACADAFAVARAARGRGLDFLPVPDNYYADLQARFGLDDGRLSDLSELDLLYDRDGAGEFVHFYTRTFGNVFFEVVERRGGYDGYGAPNAPVRLASQHSSPKMIMR